MLDLIIENGWIVDGSGNPRFKGDIGIQDGRIQWIGSFANAEAKERINAEGLIVSPGFIDIHSHSDAMPFLTPPDTGKIMQGVTTEIVGICGVSMAPVTPEHIDLLKKYCASIFSVENCTWEWLQIEDLLKKIEKAKSVCNYGTFVGHGTIRTAVMGYENRKPTEDELKKMRELVVKAIRQGAFGMTSGLVYPPGLYADSEEIVELCKAVATEGGIYTSHIRSETDEVVKAVQEAIEVGERAKIPVQIVHHKIAGVNNWGKSSITLEMIDVARNNDIDVSCDVYPYTAAATMFWSLLPPWALEGGIKKAIERLSTLENRNRIKNELESGLPNWQNFYKACGWDKILINSLNKNKQLEGKTILEIAKNWEADPADAMFNLLIDEGGDALIVLFMMSDADVNAILKHPVTMIGSDGIWSPGKTHPRYFGTFPRVLAKYVRKDHVIGLAEAIRKMTSFPAQRLGLFDRGLLRSGMWADIVIFDFDQIEDKATFENPRQRPVGIEYVIVNGEMVVRNGEYTGVFAGKVLKK